MTIELYAPQDTPYSAEKAQTLKTLTTSKKKLEELCDQIETNSLISNTDETPVDLDCDSPLKFKSGATPEKSDSDSPLKLETDKLRKREMKADSKLQSNEAKVSSRKRLSKTPE